MKRTRKFGLYVTKSVHQIIPLLVIWLCVQCSNYQHEEFKFQLRLLFSVLYKCLWKRQESFLLSALTNRANWDLEEKGRHSELKNNCVWGLQLLFLCKTYLLLKPQQQNPLWLSTSQGILQVLEYDSQSVCRERESCRNKIVWIEILN